MGNVYDDFIEPMLMQFDLPKAVRDDNEKQAGFFSDYDEALEEFTSHELQHAAKLLKTTRTSRTYPTIADCLEACKQAHDALQPPVKKRRQEQGTPPEWTDERQRQANRLISSSEIGKEAADEGWLYALWDFCRKNERLPNRFEAQKIAEYSRGTWKYVDEAIQDNISRGLDPEPILKHKETMIKRLQFLRSKVYEDAVAS